MATRWQFELAGALYRLTMKTPRAYVLDDGSRLPVIAWPAWCERCRQVTEAEHILSAAEEAKEVDEAENLLVHAEDFRIHHRPVPREGRLAYQSMPELRARRRWLAARRSPPKCLECGSVDVVSIWPGPEVEIPGRGTCVGRFVGFIDLSPQPPAEYYGVEGNRLRPDAAAGGQPGA